MIARLVHWALELAQRANIILNNLQNRIRMKKIVKCEVELPAGYENDGMLENLLSAKIEDAFAESYGVNGDDIMAYNVEVINE